jgi:hypothetical protein
VWEDANRLLRKVKQVIRRCFSKAGGAQTLEQRLEMNKAAWDAVHDQWPPPPDVEPLTSLRDYVEGIRGLGESARAELPAISAAAEARFKRLFRPDDPVADIQLDWHKPT